MRKFPDIPVWREMGATPPPLTETVERRPVVIVGGGPVGLSLALDLGRRGHSVVVLNRLDFIAAGSKAICFAKRTLDIWDRLGVGEAMVEKGVVWNVGKVFWGDGKEPVYQFDVLPVKDQKMPGFINLQQYHVEDRLVQALVAYPNVDLRWGHEVMALDARDDEVEVRVRAGDVTYRIAADWLIACDGSRSSVREMMGLDFEGRLFEDHFLIADIRMKGTRPIERWFWFDPPFNPGKSALLHKQPDDVWRLDFQLGWNVDRAACLQPENVEPLVRGMVGDEVEFEKEWYSLYTFRCCRMDRFVHDRVIFAGDSAHLVSPFGARGCNGGVADIDNLGWKLDYILTDQAPTSLLDSYNHEAVVTADENIANASRSTDFMTPKSAVSRAFRDAVLSLAADCPFARPLVNSGRLATWVAYPDSPLNTRDEPGEVWAGIAPGEVLLDAVTGDGWLLERTGDDFCLLAHGWEMAVPDGVSLVDLSGEATALERLDLETGSATLVRPDQYVVARWRAPTTAKVEAALARATGRSG